MSQKTLIALIILGAAAVAAFFLLSKKAAAATAPAGAPQPRARTGWVDTSGLYQTEQPVVVGKVNQPVFDKQFDCFQAKQDRLTTIEALAQSIKDSKEVFNLMPATLRIHPTSEARLFWARRIASERIPPINC